MNTRLPEDCRDIFRKETCCRHAKFVKLNARFTTVLNLKLFIFDILKTKQQLINLQIYKKKDVSNHLASDKCN